MNEFGYRIKKFSEQTRVNYDVWVVEGAVSFHIMLSM